MLAVRGANQLRSEKGSGKILYFENGNSGLFGLSCVLA
jgi:hypothetical protein